MTNHHDPSAAAAAARTDADYMAALERWFLTELRKRTDARTAERIFRAEWAQMLVYSADNLRTITADEPGYIPRVADRAVVRYRNNPDELADADELTEDELRSRAELRAAWLAALRPAED